MHPNVMVSEKAWNTWLEICYAWFDYDSASYVTNKAYNLHVDIDLILMRDEPIPMSSSTTSNKL